jgi:hypothetical protein
MGETAHSRVSHGSALLSNARQILNSADTKALKVIIAA